MHRYRGACAVTLLPESECRNCCAWARDLHVRLRVRRMILLALAGLRNGAKAMPLGSEFTI